MLVLKVTQTPTRNRSPKSSKWCENCITFSGVGNLKKRLNYDAIFLPMGPYILSHNIGKGVMWGFSFVFDDKNARQGKASNDSRTKVEKVISKTWGKAVIKTWHFSLINKKNVDMLTLETCEGISQLLELESFRWAAWFSGKVRDWK